MYSHLLPYCTTKMQERIIELLNEGKRSVTISRAVGVNDSSVRKNIRVLKARYALKNQDAHDNGKIGEGFSISKVSEYQAATEDRPARWLIRDRDKEDQERAMQIAVEAMCLDIPRLPAIKAPKHTQASLLNLYVITDYHIGMLAWDDETGGDNWDTDIASSLLLRWFEAAIASSPEAETGVLCNLGDFLHFSGLEAITPESGHILDADTRFDRVVDVAIITIRRIIDMLLHKHKKVHVIMAEGNHDRDASPWLRRFFHHMYDKEKRVTVDTSPTPYYCIEHGYTSLFFHHGHKKNVSNVSDVFAAMFRPVFGRTKFSYAHMGHKHHIDVKETNLMVVEQHRTLASNDAYASRGGWLSGREASCITYHKDYGQTGRVTITPDMVRA